MSTTLHKAQVSGTTVLTLQDKSVPVVRFALALRQGALSDPEGKSGRGRIMLELLTRGTQKQSRHDWTMALERLGSNVGASLGSEFGIVRGISLKKHLDATLALVAEALHQPAFAQSETEPLIDEVLELLRSEREDDDSLAEIFLRRALYPEHRLWRSPMGEPKDLLTLNQDDIHAAYAQHFSPQDLIVAFAGDLTPEDAAQHAQTLLQGFAQKAVPAPQTGEQHDPKGTRIVVVDKPERSQVQLRVGRLTITGSHAELYPLWLGVMAFGGTFTSTFTREVRDVRGWSYSAHAELVRRRILRTPMVLRSAPALADSLDCLALELDLYRGLAKGDVAPDAIDFARSYLLNRTPFEVATAADLMLPALKNELLGLPPEELWKTTEHLEAVTHQGVDQALKKHLHPEDVVVVLVASAKDVVAPLQKRFPSAQVTVVDYRDGLVDTEETGDSE